MTLDDFEEDLDLASEYAHKYTLDDKDSANKTDLDILLDAQFMEQE